MLKRGLLDDICLSLELQELYYKYDKLVGELAEEFAYKYMREKKEFSAVLEGLHNSSNNDVSEYTLDLMFLFACTGYLHEDYVRQNVSEDIFVNTMKDLTYKINECMRYKKVFGMFVVKWYEGFLKMKRFAFGRLQFDIWDQHTNILTVKNFSIDENTFSLNCHIPSSGPLEEKQVIRSFKMAYSYFEDKFDGGILPIFCESWLLYPMYKEIFRENSPNIDLFVSNFTIYNSNKSDYFNDAWRIFNMNIEGDTSKLPQKTRLQKGFVKYIKSGGTFGWGAGVLLFDGEKVL